MAGDIVDIIKNANSSDRGKFDIKSILSSVGFSLVISVVLIIVFSVLRPRNTVVYAPKVKYADEKHQPPRLSNTPWAWIKPVIATKENDMIDRLGLDAVVFLRFLRMCRNMFIVLSIIGCGAIIPINVIGTNHTTRSSSEGTTNPLLRLTVAGLQGSWLYPHIAFGYVFTFIMLFFIWVNYKAVVRLRQQYFGSDEYQSSLHARTLMLIDLPNKARSDEALQQKAMHLKSPAQFSQAQIGRDVGALPALIEKHDSAVRKLEGVLAKYLKNPAKLPPNRPMCKGHNGQVDAIDYYTSRVQSLEAQIEAARDGNDKLHPRPYGFVSYPSIPAAHGVAKANKSNNDVFLAPRPLDIIWKNMGRPQSTRSTNRFFGNVLFVSLCFLWTVPNALIATFISNIYNLAAVWPWLQGRINAQPTLWAILQGILAPIILGIFFLLLPSIMRRISEWEGSLTRNARERNVFHKLFLFFFINNFLIFSLFNLIFSLVQTTIVVTAQQNTGFSGFWEALKSSQFFNGLANAITSTSTFWIIYVAQRNLGCLLDLVQVWLLFLKWFKRTFLSPSPREMIEWSAPQNFDYASYYNTFIFNLTICLAYATLAPLILPFGLLYFVVSEFTYKYGMLYVSVTKVESGGEFWRILINRLLLVLGFSNLILFVVIWTRVSIFIAIAVAPLAVIIIAFKIFLLKHYDPVFDFYTLHQEQVHRNDLKKDRLRSRFGHPALHQALIVPMVHERSKHLLREVYKGRLNHEDGESSPTIGTDKSPADLANAFEVVPQSDLNFEAYMNRPDFRQAAGLYDSTPRKSSAGSMLSSHMTVRPPYPSMDSEYKERAFDEYSVESGQHSMYGAWPDSSYELSSMPQRPRPATSRQLSELRFDEERDRGQYESQEDLTNLLYDRNDRQVPRRAW